MLAGSQAGRQALHLAQAAEKKQLSGLNQLQSSQPHTSNTCPCEELSTIPPIAEKDQATMLNDVCLSALANILAESKTFSCHYNIKPREKRSLSQLITQFSTA